MKERVDHVRDYYNPGNHKGDTLFRRIESEEYRALDYCDIHTSSIKAGSTLSLYCAEKYMASVQATWKCNYPIDMFEERWCF